MSRMTIKAVWLGEKAENLLELRNAHGGASVIWRTMAGQYLGDARSYCWDSEKEDQLWQLSKRVDIPKHHRAVMMITYDDAYLVKADYARAAADIRAFFADFPQSVEYVCHWPKILEILESVDLDAPAIGFYWTSVGEDPFEGDWNDETDERDPPDWSRLWNVYQVFDEMLEAEQSSAISVNSGK